MTAVVVEKPVKKKKPVKIEPQVVPGGNEEIDRPRPDELVDRDNKIISEQCRTCKYYRDPMCCYDPPKWRDYSKRYEFVKTTPHQWCGKWKHTGVK